MASESAAGDVAPDGASEPDLDHAFEPRAAETRAAPPDAPVEPSLREASGTARTADAAAPRPSGLAQAPGRLPWLSGLAERLDARLPDAERWRSLELDLGEQRGRLSVRARQSEAGVVVAVHLSDPAAQATALAQADEIRQRLEQHYGASVDLHFGSGGDSGTPTPAHTRRSSGSSGPAPEAAPPSVPARPPTASREWIG